MSLENPTSAPTPSKKELIHAERERALALHERTKEILERVDFKTLKDVLTEERAKAGIEKPDQFECSLKNVQMMYIGGAHGGYFSDEKSVVLDPLQIMEAQYDENFDKIPPEKLDLETEVLSTLFHEETHGASKASGLPSSPPADIVAFMLSYVKPIRLGASGLTSDARIENGKFQRGHLHLFNEAVTDRIAEDVWYEYHKRTGKEVKEGHVFRSNYSMFVGMLEAFIAHTASLANVPGDTVWQGIKHAYFNGTDMGSSDVKDAFEELAMGEILKGIENVGHAGIEHILPLYERMNIADAPEEIQQKITKAVEVLQRGLALREARKEEGQ